MDQPEWGDGPGGGGAGDDVAPEPGSATVASTGPRTGARPGTGVPPGDDAAGDGEAGTALPRRVEAWRKRSAAGAILTGFALGLQEVLETHRDEPSIVVQTSGDPPDDLPVEAEFEYGRPRQSVVNIRPWMLKESRREGDDRPAGES